MQSDKKVLISAIARTSTSNRLMGLKQKFSKHSISGCDEIQCVEIIIMSTSAFHKNKTKKTNFL